MKNKTFIFHDSCTTIYIGKNLTKNKSPIIGRSSDNSPLFMHHYEAIFPIDAFKNKVVKGVNGFKYKMPNKTYRFISTPSALCSSKGLCWESSGINENGVGVSATLTCHTNKKAMEADPFVKNGLCEDVMPRIVSALSTTAFNAMKIFANIIDKYGVNEPSAVFAIDKKEIWYMEMYTGHQYIAFKLPDDIAFIVGNEFILDTIKDFKEGDYFTSKDLFSLPKEKGFAIYEGNKDDKHMHLAKTYGVPLIKDELITNNIRRRSWLTHRLFCPNSEIAKRYISTEFFKSYVTPERKDYTIYDVLKLFRYRFDRELNDPNFKQFKDDLNNHSLRLVGAESGYQIHIMTINKGLPNELGISEWLNLSSTNYSPFLPTNNGLLYLDKNYTYIAKSYDYDEKAASFIFKRLNLLANHNWDRYGSRIQSMWEDYEYLYGKEYEKLLKKIKNMPLDKAKRLLSEQYIKMQQEVFEIARYTYNDLLVHIMDNQNAYSPNDNLHEIKLFHPLVVLNQYINKFDYTYRRKDKNTVILTKGNNIYTIKLSNNDHNSLGTLTYKNKKFNIYTKTRNNKVYVSKDDIDNILKIKIR